MTDTRSPAHCASATGLRDAALAYAGGGHRVFPVHPARKQPLRARPEEGDEPLPLADWQDPTKGGFHAGVCDEHLVRMWWAIQYRGAGIGYSIPPNVFVLDDDNGDGMERLRAIRPDLADELWECGAIVQSRRGRHYYFSVPDTFAPVAQTGSAALHLPDTHIRKIFDVKGGAAGYSILPPTGGKSWERGSLDTIHDASPALLRLLDHEHAAPAPAAKTAAAPGAARSRASLTTFTPAVEALPTEPVRGHGFRHHTLLSEGGRLRQRGYGLEVILPALQEVNARFEEPHTDAKVRELAADIVDRYEPGEGPRPEPEAAVAPAAQAAEVVQPQDAALRPVPVERPELPQDRAGVERGIAELTTWRLARSQRRNGAIVYSEDGGPWKVLGKVDRAVLMQMLAEAAVMYVPVKGGGSAPDAPIPFVIPKTNDLDRYLGFIANKVWVDDDDSEGYYGRVREWAETPAVLAGATATKAALAPRRAGMKVKEPDIYRDPHALGQVGNALWDAGWDQVKIPVEGGARGYRWISPGHPKHRGDDRKRR